MGKIKEFWSDVLFNMDIMLEVLDDIANYHKIELNLNYKWIAYVIMLVLIPINLISMLWDRIVNKITYKQMGEDVLEAIYGSEEEA